MKKTSFVFLLAFLLMLCGCGNAKKTETAAAPGGSAAGMMETEAAVPATVPPDGNPSDVTCKGSYTGDGNADAVVASAGSAKLTNGELQAWYWAEAAQYRSAGHETAPDFDRPLDTQVCEIDSSVASWQQYFLKQALHAWHSANALILQSQEVPLETEEAYQPNLENYKTYLTDIPATKFLYGYNPYYQPNTMHQKYLDEIPAMLEALAQEKGYGDAAAMAKAAFGASKADLEAFARAYNLAYMYFTTLSYSIEPAEEEMQAFIQAHKAGYSGTGSYVDIRHILLVPDGVVPGQDAPEAVKVAVDGTVTCSEDAWMACETQANKMLEKWQQKNKGTEATFAEMANKNSQDSGTALDGGAYRRIHKGQLIPALDTWCFDDARQVGDTTVIRSDCGVHILYFSGRREIACAEAEDDYYRLQQTALVTGARETYPLEVRYSAITLSEAEGGVSAGDVLYPDVAHERYPEIPLYLQQDYPKTMYGGFPIRTNGCGITSMAMLATYMTDEEWTPPEMCARYGKYSFKNGTDGMMFNKEPPVLGFYLKEKTYDPAVAKAALEEGHVVISTQSKGYWTRGGHYIVLEEITGDGLVRVRDSNIFNYGKLEAHKQDLHTWSSITRAACGYWIFEYKITNIPACVRCGSPEGITEQLLAEDYYCEKCVPAMLRRETYLTACGESDT